ncbi:hypothetical protein RFF05_12000 [Bengtsoniella intestinalis]|uniref:hypothetical protein n=1 Tax=Bengtsoniella intestinalis TaxID=3073143 RepID=UPI00391F65A3
MCEISPILIELCTGAGCNFISDLACPVCYPQLRAYLITMDMTVYTLDQWHEAYKYMLHTPERFPDIETLRLHLLAAL